MKVSIKSFAVNMDVKTAGIELDVYSNADEHLGDLVITKTQVIWCNGKTHRENGKSLTWSKFIELMNEQE